MYRVNKISLAIWPRKPGELSKSNMSVVLFLKWVLDFLVGARIRRLGLLISAHISRCTTFAVVNSRSSCAWPTKLNLNFNPSEGSLRNR